MRQAFVHEAILVMEPEADDRAPGASVTVALCGHWEHAAPCPLAPHNVHVDRVGNELHVRVLFAAEPENEQEVRRRIELTLSGQWPVPDGHVPLWRLQGSAPEVVSPHERELAGRLVLG